MSDDSWIHYMILGVIFFGGIGAILYMRHITRDARRRDSHPPAE